MDIVMRRRNKKNRREAAGDGRLWLVAPLTGEEEGDVPKALALPE